MNALRYASGTEVKINDGVLVPSLGSFAGHVAGIFPPDNQIEVVSDNPADLREHGPKRIPLNPALAFPWWE